MAKQVFHFGFEKLEQQLNVQTKSTQIACIVDLDSGRSKRGNTLLRLLTCVADGDHRKSDSTRICCRIWIYRSSMNATSMYIARSPFRTEKKFITLIINEGGYQNLNQLQEVDTANAGVKM